MPCRYRRIVKYKTSYYSFYLPVSLKFRIAIHFSVVYLKELSVVELFVRDNECWNSNTTSWTFHFNTVTFTFSTLALGGLRIAVVWCKTWKFQWVKGYTYWNGHIFSSTGILIFDEILSLLLVCFSIYNWRTFSGWLLGLLCRSQHHRQGKPEVKLFFRNSLSDGTSKFMLCFCAL